MSSEVKKYLFFGFAMLLLQLVGYNIATLGLLGLCMFPVISMKSFLNNIQTVPLYFIFLSLSIVDGIYFGLCNGLEKWKIMYWGQFYFFVFFLLAVEDQHQALNVLKYSSFLIFFADLFTNILLLIGFNVPWADIPTVRQGETMARFGGLKGNTLYSGSISFIAFSFLLEQDFSKKAIRYLCIFSSVFNMILSGSYRYFIIASVVYCIYFFHLYKRPLILCATYISSIVIVFFATRFTMLVSVSNFFRYNIWNYYVNQIANSSVIGHGWFNMHLDINQDFSWPHLAANGVTESCILLIAYCFGIPMLILYLICILTTLKKYINYSKYVAELGIFVGLTLDLFWGGSFDNSLSLSVMTLSWYLINRYQLEKFHTVQKQNE
jgi:hypothetical protein